ncbi:MAG: GC-type dockerin domain-anchored protein [Phycisphaerales bacterium JB060]
MHERSVSLAARTPALLAAAGLAACPAAMGQADPLTRPFPVSISVDELPAGTWRAIGPGLPGGQHALAGAGDVNGDGPGDVVLAGGAIVFGRVGGEPIINLNHLGETGARFGANNHAGGLGDVNGDGFDDFGVGDEFHEGPGGERRAGRAYVVFGNAGGYPDGIDLTRLDGRNGFELRGVAEQSRVGTAITAAGDVNGDGIGDLLVTQDGRLSVANGALHIIFGRDRTAGHAFGAVIDLDEPTDGTRVRFDGRHRTDWNGSAAALGDVNGDGLDDVAVVERFRVYVLFGRPAPDPWPRTLSDADIDGRTGFSAGGLSFLTRVSRAGDFNGDGVNDVLIGAPFSSPGGRYNAGTAAVLFGRADGVFPTLVDLDTLAPGDGFVMEGEHAAFPSEDRGDRAGYSIAGPGDVNGDGFDDVLIGAPGADYTGSPVYGDGMAYLVFGREEGFAAPLMLANLDGRAGVEIHGGPAGIGFAFVVGGVGGPRGDFNGDGRPDMLISANRASTPGLGASGGVFIILGRSVCEPDLDGDGALTIFDFLAFQDLFQDADPRADFDGDGSLTIVDFLAFQAAFDAGCP